jgi:hypothetical protein
MKTLYDMRLYLIAVFVRPTKHLALNASIALRLDKKVTRIWQLQKVLKSLSDYQITARYLISTFSFANTQPNSEKPIEPFILSSLG